MGSASDLGKLQPGSGLGNLAGIPPIGEAWADDVRPDDGRVMDLHRYAGHCAGHLRDLRRGRGETVRRNFGWDLDAHRWLRWYGRRPAPSGDAERGGLLDRRR